MFLDITCCCTCRSKKLPSPISSLTLSGSGNQFYAATTSSLLYSFDHSDFSHEKLGSCHHDTITDVCFPKYVCMYREELAASFGLSLTLFCSWFAPAQGILGAVCDQQPWQRKGVACQFKQGASQDQRSQHSLQRSRDFSWWQCHYHGYAVSRVINLCDRMSLFPSSCCPLFSSSSMNNIAWADGTIRAYYPESGKPMYTIHNAHGKVSTTHFI